MQNITAISYMRVSSMILIVLYHSFCYYTGLWGFYECVIPLYARFYSIFCFIGLNSFIFIAGFLYSYLTYKAKKYQNNKSFLINKVKRLLVPYIVWGVSIMVIFRNTFHEFIFGISHLWFLLTLFIVFLIAIITKRIWYNASKMTDICLLISTIIIWLVKDFILKINIGWVCKEVFVFLPAFYGGMLMAKYDVIQKIKRFKYMFQLNNLLLLFLSALLVSLFANDLSNSGIVIILVYFIPPLIFIMYNFLFRTEKIPNFIISLDKNCMGIYILHHILIWLFIIYLGGNSILNIMKYWGPLFLFVLSFFLSWMLSCFINKNKISKILFG